MGQKAISVDANWSAGASSIAGGSSQIADNISALTDISQQSTTLRDEAGKLYDSYIEEDLSCDRDSADTNNMGNNQKEVFNNIDEAFQMAAR